MSERANLLATSFERETIISELESLTRRDYGQYCGVARALEVVGERWGLLIVRDLLVSGKTYAELLHGLPLMSPDILSARLRELTRAGVVDERETPGGATVYVLTALGQDLEDVLLGIGRWGAKLLGDARPEEIVTPDSLVMALRTTFVPKAAAGVLATYEIHVGETVLNARVSDGALRAAAGPLPGADLVLEAGASLKNLMTGEVSPQDALAAGLVQITGDRALFDQFVAMFRI
jgi:DNA-binding HxlR family transcriptional regulator